MKKTLALFILTISFSNIASAVCRYAIGIQINANTIRYVRGPGTLESNTNCLNNVKNLFTSTSPADFQAACNQDTGSAAAIGRLYGVQKTTAQYTTVTSDSQWMDASTGSYNCGAKPVSAAAPRPKYTN